MAYKKKKGKLKYQKKKENKRDGMVDQRHQRKWNSGDRSRSRGAANAGI